MNKDLFRIYDLYDEILSQKRILEAVSTYSPPNNITVAQGVDLRLDSTLQGILNKIASEYKGKITITSGYRDQTRNKNAGGVDNSQHLTGKAVDIKIDNYGNKENIINFIGIASKNGIGGIGVYDTYMHLDVGGKRYWGSDNTKNSVRDWLIPTLEKHVKGELNTSTIPDNTTPQNPFGSFSQILGVQRESINESIKVDDIPGKNLKNKGASLVLPYRDNSKIKSAVKGKVNNLNINKYCKNEITIEFTDSNDTYYLEYCGIGYPKVKNEDKVGRNDVLGTTNADVEVTLRDSYFNKINFLKPEKKPSTSSNPSGVEPGFFGSLLRRVAKPFEKGWESPTSGKKPDIFPGWVSPTSGKKANIFGKDLNEQSLKNIGINNFRDLFNKMPQELQKRVYELKKIPQNKKWHPEGNVLKHTITVVNRALKSDDIDLAIAAIMHDIGKDETLKFNEKTNEPTAYGHENVSADLVNEYKDWIESIGGDPEIVHYIVKNHMSIKYFDVMKQSKIDKIKSNPNYDKLSKFGEYDKGGLKIENNKKLQENIQRIKQILK